MLCECCVPRRRIMGCRIDCGCRRYDLLVSALFPGTEYGLELRHM